MKGSEVWKGYNRHELGVRRAVNAVRLEIAKEDLMQRFEGKEESAVSKFGSFLFNNPAILLRTLTIGTTVYSVVRNIFGRRRR